MESNQKERERFTGLIRPFQENDVPEVKKILEHWLRDEGLIAHDEVEEDLSDMMRSLEPESDIDMLIAEENGQVIGMMGLSIPPKDALMQYAKTDYPSELRIAYVDPKRQGGYGVGTALLYENIRLARTKGRKELLLESGPRHKETGYPFYDKQPGLEREGVLKDFYGPGLDSQVWRKTF
jgi:predicted N-acetyltransferase YhbS